MLWGKHFPHHSFQCFLIETCLVIYSIAVPSLPSTQHEPPPGRLGRQRAITMVIRTQIPHTPVHCDWCALRWEGTKCQSNRFFRVFVFASILGGIVLRSMCWLTLRGLLEWLSELGKQVVLTNELKEMDCKMWLKVFEAQTLRMDKTLSLLWFYTCNINSGRMY